MSAFNHRLVVIPSGEQPGALCGMCGDCASHYARSSYYRKGRETSRERKLCPRHAKEWRERFCEKEAGWVA